MGFRTLDARREFMSPEQKAELLRQISLEVLGVFETHVDQISTTEFLGIIETVKVTMVFAAME